MLAARFFPAVYQDTAFLLLSLALAFGGTLATRRLSQWLVGVGSQPRRTIIVGAGESAQLVQNLMSHVQPLRYEIVGCYPTGPAAHAVTSHQRGLLDGKRSLIDLARENRVVEIVVALDDRRGALPIDDLLKAKLSGIQVTDLVAFYERECYTVKFEKMYPSWIVFSSDFQLGPGRRIAKRVFDVAAALTLLALSAPLLFLVAVMSLVESRGRDPVLYHQERVGYGGRTFRLHKFRSMTVNAEGDGQARWASADDVRVTPLGRVLRRYRLDELPQLFNILAGDMSLVGPRPERPEFVEDLSRSIPYYRERHCVKPGLAGWAQLMYPYGASIKDAKHKLEYDLYYIKHTSVIWDLVILMRTVEVVLLGKGVR
jgi:sugar transferase (PEP-CTERM system associated)